MLRNKSHLDSSASVQPHAFSKWLIAALALICLFSTPLLVTSLHAKNTPSKGQTEPDIAMRNYMLEISRQIGVTCTHCHDTNDYKSKKKAPYQVAATHIEMVQLLNDKYKGKIGEKVDCYMCHKGTAKPHYKEKLSI